MLEFGEQKFPQAGLLRSSAGRNWRGIAAELRSHPVCDVPAIVPHQMEVTVAIRGSRQGRVERRGAGQFQQTTPKTGTLWLCPIGVAEDSIRITAPLPEILHLYVGPEQFRHLSDLSSRRVVPDEIFYLADVEDELVRQIGYRVARELDQESAGGNLLIEQLSLSLLTHLVGSYSSHGRLRAPDRGPGALDGRRLARVLDCIEENLGSDLTLESLAEVACLSRYHFARAFRDATGVPPHRFISARRLDHAKQLLGGTSLSLAEVAFACCFSSQASFTRAFHKRVGMAPGEYRKRAGA
ncbi:MAG TPA: AraC family transcriptional regulator [Pseudolabrys sp.]|nr:AraC family transcriptional regulator [Pseudolabrys sp.]